MEIIKLNDMANFSETVFKNMRGIIAILVSIGSFSFLFVLMFKPIPIDNKDIINISAGLVLAGLGGVISYYFGASKDKSDAEKAARIVDPESNPEIVNQK